MVAADLGIGNWLIQTADYDRDRLRAALGLVLAGSVLSAAALVGGAAGVAALTGREEVLGLMAVMALAFALVPINTLAVAILRRTMRFGALMVAENARRIPVVDGRLEVAGFGAYSLAWAYVADLAALTAVLMCYRPRGLWVLPAFAGARPILAFGLTQTGINLLGAAGTQLPQIAVGTQLGAAAAGRGCRAMSRPPASPGSRFPPSSGGTAAATASHSASDGSRLPVQVAKASAS